MNISNESLLKILAVAVVAYFLLSGSSTKPKPEKFMYQGCSGLGLDCAQHIRMRQGQGNFEGLRIRTRADDYVDSNLSVNPAPIMGNIMGSQYISNHIRRDRRNNMLNSMMRGCDGSSPQDCAGMP
jgi:hypothetical protein